MLVEEADGSRRLLRDHELRARGQFAWGYGGGGPHALAEVLVADVLDRLARCPACLGSSPCGAGVVACAHCDGTGQRRELLSASGNLFDEVTGRRDIRTEFPPSLDGADWSVPRSTLLRLATSKARTAR
jgi:hypothetical protein